MKPLLIREYYSVWAGVVLQDTMVEHQKMIHVVFGKFLVTVQFERFHLEFISLELIGGCFDKIVPCFEVGLPSLFVFVVFYSLKSSTTRTKWRWH